MKSATIKASVTPAGSKALAALGLSAEERGGDAKSSLFGRKVGRSGRVARTATVVIVSRRDGGDLTAQDIKAARATLA